MSAAHILRPALALAGMALGGAGIAAAGVPLSFADRVACRAAIEDVYWRHRIWPDGAGSPKPVRSAILADERIGRDVEETLRYESALRTLWNDEIPPPVIQAELDRIARHTQDAATLGEIFAALGEDPYRLAECLVRPQLVRQRIEERYRTDRELHREGREAAAREAARAGGEVHEEEDAFRVLLKARPRDGRTARIATRLWRKRSFAAWWAQERAAVEPADPPAAAYSFAAPGESCVAADTWSRPPQLALPEARSDHTAVWTGSEMIVWGGRNGGSFLRSGGRYNPATDTWLPVSTVGAPGRRALHTAVWTGSEMIVWGGFDGADLGSGGRYDPASDAWTPVASNGAPAGRAFHTAVWTGNAMIVWGGNAGAAYFGDGARYSPATDAWTPVTTSSAPAARASHSAVWTGSRMIVWGGADNGLGMAGIGTGGRYDPATDSWTATSLLLAPMAREFHTAVWTGGAMIVWGGYQFGPGGVGSAYVNTGARYDLGTDSWTATATANAPAARVLHTAVWSGSAMIVWGGGGLASGGRYDPGSDTWSSTATTGAPTGRLQHTALWTGSAMIVWGGYNGGPFQSGGRYNPSSDTWLATSETAAPAGRSAQSAVWTGAELIVWGGSGSGVLLDSGGRYTPATDTWTATTRTGAPLARSGHSAVWTGGEMLVWGGSDGSTPLDSGGRYNPASDAWTATGGAGGTGAPAPRQGHAAVWTGSEMLVWGGYGGGFLNSGGRYTPATDSWTAMTANSAPAARSGPAAVWSGSEWIVWGGADGSGPLATGGRYAPAANTWTATAIGSSPVKRLGHAAVWTGSEMLVWGGSDGANDLNSGGRYRPGNNTWATITTADAPAKRSAPGAVFTGGEMIVWGGTSAGVAVETGGRYNPASGAWAATSASGAAAARTLHSAIWAPGAMVVWGGKDGADLASGGLYHPNAPPVAAGLALSVGAGSSAALTLAGSDANCDSLTYSVVTSPQHGALSGTPPNLTYTPSPGYNGADSLSFKVNDGTFDSNVAAVQITVSATGALSFFTLPPCRALDTRAPGQGPALAAGQARRVTLAGLCGVPANAKAAALNMTAAQPTSAGSVTLTPDGSPALVPGTVNLLAAQTRANNAVLGFSATSPGTIVAIANLPGGATVHLVVDVVGYFR